MSGFLAGIVSSQRGVATAVRPRPVGRFEAAGRGHGSGVDTGRGHGSSLDIETDIGPGHGGDVSGGTVSGALLGEPVERARPDDRPGADRPAPGAAGRFAAPSGGPFEGVGARPPGPPRPGPGGSQAATADVAAMVSPRPAHRPPAAPPGDGDPTGTPAAEGPRASRSRATDQAPATDSSTPPSPARQPAASNRPRLPDSPVGPALVPPPTPAGVRRAPESAAAAGSEDLRQGAAAGAAVQPVVHVTIGRIEIRANAPAPGPTTRRASAPRQGVMSLDEYIAQRGSGR